MVKIVVNTISQLKAINQKLKVITNSLPTLQIQALERAADDTILSGIHRDMETGQFSKKIIEKTVVGKVELLNNGKKAKVHFISDYISDSGFDVSSAREEGTTDHDVFPKNPNGILSYIDKSGKRVFSKHTHPSGIKRLLLIENNISKNRQSFKNNYDKQMISTLQQMMV